MAGAGGALVDSTGNDGSMICGCDADKCETSSTAWVGLGIRGSLSGPDVITVGTILLRATNVGCEIGDDTGGTTGASSLLGAASGGVMLIEPASVASKLMLADGEGVSGSTTCTSTLELKDTCLADMADGRLAPGRCRRVSERGLLRNVTVLVAPIRAEGVKVASLSDATAAVKSGCLNFPPCAACGIVLTRCALSVDNREEAKDLPVTVGAVAQRGTRDYRVISTSENEQVPFGTKVAWAKASQSARTQAYAYVLHRALLTSV